MAAGADWVALPEVVTGSGDPPVYVSAVDGLNLSGGVPAAPVSPMRGLRRTKSQ